MAVDEARDLRLVELLGALSLATDLGTGQPPSTGVRSAVLAAAVAAQLDLPGASAGQVLQVGLLRFLGCTADSAETARLAGGDDVAFRAAMAPVTMGVRPEMARRLIGAVGPDRPVHQRAALIAGALTDPGGARRSLSAHCEVAALLATRLGVGAAVREALAHGYERWDGAGFPDGLAGEVIPAAVRIAVVARDAEAWWRSAPDRMVEMLAARRGRAHDPAVSDAVRGIAPALLAGLDTGDAWAALLAAADADDRVPPDRLDAALTAIADFADLKSPWTRGHSRRVADLAAGAAGRAGMPAHRARRLHRSGLVHDLGRVGVPNGIWDRPGPLGVAESQRMRMHPYLTESVLACCPALADLGRLAGVHHERIDGSGYHRGSRDLDLPARILAAADVVAALGEPRPHRPAAAAPAVAATVAAEVRAGRLDSDAVAAVLAAAGQPGRPRPAAWPAGLTDREVQVLRLIARGRTNRETAAALRVSVKTVGRHVENLYAKAGVRTRAGAAVFALEHRLLDADAE